MTEIWRYATRRGWAGRSAGVVVVLLASLAPPAADACSCTRPADPQTEMEHADAVFSGRVTTVERFADRGFRRLVVHFALAAVWKGVPQRAEVAVTTAADGATCGYAFSEGEEYLVWAYGEDDDLTTGLCTRNALLSEAAEDLAALGPPGREVAVESSK